MGASLRLGTAIIIVLMVSVGQILFKLAAEKLRLSGGQLTMPVLTTIALSLLIYGIATLGWIWVLQWYPLSRIYPLMAMSFVMVPIGGALLFAERLTPSYFGGTALLLAGLFLIILPRT